MAIVTGAVVVWFGLRLGTLLEGAETSLPALTAALDAMLAAPFDIRVHQTSLKTLGLLLAAYAFAAMIFLSSPKRDRPGEEHGSAQWANPAKLGNNYRDKRGANHDIILTSRVRIGAIDKCRVEIANRNILIIGGPGSGKTFTFVKPNLLQMNGSYLITDPKGEILRDIAPALIAKGIPFTVLNFTDKPLSDCYNPFAYIREDADVQKLVTNLIKNTTPKGARSSEPFWEKSETAIITAFILYLKYEAAPEQQTFSAVCELIEKASASEDEKHVSATDELFEQLEERKPESLAVRYYHVFKQAAGKTAKSILIAAAVRLQAFLLPEVARITKRDDMRLGELGDKRRYIFCVIPDTDTSLNFLVGMLYSQAFQELYRAADANPDGKLKIPVTFMLDEFANVALPDDFQHVLATCRGRNIRVNIIIQAIAQLKELFEKSWEVITGNCAVTLYLGGNEHDTHKYISELMGKETINTQTQGKTRGQHGGGSTNYQTSGRELMTSDEVRNLPKGGALLFIQSERPVRDRKNSAKKHPNFAISGMGKGKPYKRVLPPVPVLADVAPIPDGATCSITTYFFEEETK
jgi:type IV secretion system protein VirD4